MKSTSQRKAFSILTAIFIMLIMSGIGAIVMSLTSTTVKETTAQFQREQAILLAKSYTEYAIMAVMANDRNGTASCLQTINSDNVIRSENAGGFEVRVQVAYIGNGDGTIFSCLPTTILSNANTTSTQSPLNVLIDVYVKYKDYDHHAITPTGSIINVPYITYHKRTLQKI